MQSLDPQPNAEDRDRAGHGARDRDLRRRGGRAHACGKLGDQVVVTDTRCRVLAPFPFRTDSSLPDLGLDMRTTTWLTLPVSYFKEVE